MEVHITNGVQTDPIKTGNISNFENSSRVIIVALMMEKLEKPIHIALVWKIAFFILTVLSAIALSLALYTVHGEYMNYSRLADLKKEAY